MKRVRFRGEHPEIFPTLGWEAQPGDVREVPDEVEHPRLEPVEAEPASRRTAGEKGEK